METLEDIKHSSDFYAGDAMGFSVKTKKYTLPGKHDPAQYLKNVMLKGKVLVLFPGNGGLINEISDMYETFFYEPRLQCKKALSRILSVTKSSATETMDFGGRYDTVIWSEGFEQIKDPLTILNPLLENLKGTLYLELVHGSQDSLFGNSVRPTEQAFKKYLQDGNFEYAMSPGRLENRIIYKISKKVVKVEPIVTDVRALDATPPIVEDPDSKQRRKKIKKTKQ